MELNLQQAPVFLQELQAIKKLEDWVHFKYKYAVLRNSEKFWPIYDWIYQWSQQHKPIESGYLDLSYYDLFDRVY